MRLKLMSRMQNYNEFNQLTETIIKGYKAIDEIKYVISQELCQLEKDYNNRSKLLEQKKSCPTFQNFLVERLSKTYAQVIPVLRVGRYIKEQKLSIWNITEIPINKLEIVAKAKIPWTDDVYHNLLTMGYNNLRRTYDEKYKEKDYEKAANDS